MIRADPVVPTTPAEPTDPAAADRTGACSADRRRRAMGSRRRTARPASSPPSSRIGDGPERPPPPSSPVAAASASEADAAAVLRSLGDDVGRGFGKALGGGCRLEPGSGATVDEPAVGGAVEPGAVVPGIVE